jgi:NAD(P)-dependent dehydrogenase (short-subunit alcohol dehydrogenase family)
MATSLRDKTVLITGGALGIGAETARRLHADGARLVLVDLDQAALEKTAGELGPGVVAVVGDVRELADMERAVAEGVEWFGGIDVGVANAGISSYGSVRAVDPAAFKRVLDVNVLGVSSLAAFAASTWAWPT